MRTRIVTLALTAALVACGLSLSSARLDAASPATFAVNSVLDEVDKKPGDGICKSKPSRKYTLRAAIMEANARPGKDKIILRAGTYLLTRAGENEDKGATGDLDFKSNLTLVGRGAATTIIDADSNDRVAHILRGKVKLSKLTLTHGAGIYNPDGYGGGIYIARDAKLTLDQAVLTLNAADSYASIRGWEPHQGQPVPVLFFQRLLRRAGIA